MGHTEIGNKTEAPEPEFPNTPKPPPDDYKPQWKAEFYISMKIGPTGKYSKVLALGDTGSNRCTISEDFFRNNPTLRERPYRQLTTRGTAINGSKVLTIGIVNVPFRINNNYMAINCRVVRGLIQPIILGWDFFSKFNAKLNPTEGLLEFRNWSPIPLVKDTSLLSGCYYRIHEDVTVPANSKMHKLVELMADKDHIGRASKVVLTEPFINDGSDVWTCRVASEVNNCMFLTEFTNPSERDVKLEAGRVLGYADFCSTEELESSTWKTDMFNSFRSEDPPEDPRHSEAESDDEPEEILCDQPPLPKTPEEPPQPQDTPPPPKVNIPSGAKPLHIDYANICEEAKPFRKELKELLEVKHEEAFSKHDRDYGRTSLIQFRAHLKDPPGPPIAVPPYRTRPEVREHIDKQAFEMIADGLVSHSTSPYSAPILLAKKKTYGYRFLTDFRKVNEQCDKVVYPLPRIEDSLQRLDNPRIFSTMDLTKGFWQIPIHPDDRKLFAFSTENMHLEYMVAPMGAKNSPSYLTALMMLVLRGLPPQHIISYLDDILVADSCMEDHLHHLDLVLTALRKAGLKLNPAKCGFAQDSVVCLGHKLSKDGLSPDPANIKKIRSWKPPENAKKLKTFLGLTGYYRQFVKDYSKVAQVLTDLTKDDAEWVWNKEHQEAFETLRDILTSNQIMCYPDFTKPFCIKSDASLSAIGFVLTQKIDGKEKVISYGSKKLSPTQQRWSTFDREFFALLCAVRSNAHYLRHAPFLAITDHRPLLAWKKIDSKKDPTGRRTRWTIELNTYEFDLIHKPGKSHADADAMSRRGDDDDEVAEDPEDFTFLGMICEEEFELARYNALEDDIDKLREAQDDDETIAIVKSFLKARRRIPESFPVNWYKANSKFLTLYDGILYKRAYSEATHLEILQAVIPPSMVPEILSEVHGSYMSGHPSQEKMVLMVKRYAIWPTVSRDIKDFIRNCDVCDQEREPNPANRTPRIPIEAQNVWDHVICDLISLPTGSLGFHYVLVFIDVFSGYVKLFKLKDKNTIGVCRAFEDLTCTIGAPRLLTSDNGGEFESAMLKEMCQIKGAAKRTSVAYRPQSQGPVERFNRTLIKDLKKRLIQYGHSWVTHLPYVEWSYNNTPRYNSKMTPYFLMFGREAPLTTFVKDEAAAGSAVKEASGKTYIEGVKKRTRDVIEEARTRIEARRSKDREAYDQKAKHTPLEEGDRVYERVPDGLRDKLQSKWSGPLTVIRRRQSPQGDPGTTYICERSDGKQVNRNYEQLKKSRVRTEPPEPREPRHMELQPLKPVLRNQSSTQPGKPGFLISCMQFLQANPLNRPLAPPPPSPPPPTPPPGPDPQPPVIQDDAALHGVTPEVEEPATVMAAGESGSSASTQMPPPAGRSRSERTLPTPLTTASRSRSSAPTPGKSHNSRSRSAADRPPSGERIQTRAQCAKQKDKEETMRTGMAKVRSTVESTTSRPPSHDLGVDESIPDVFASFCSADLIRNNIADMPVFDEPEEEAIPSRESIQTIDISSDVQEESNPEASTSEQANQSSILQPLSYFFGYGRGSPAISTEEPQESSTPKE